LHNAILDDGRRALDSTSSVEAQARGVYAGFKRRYPHAQTQLLKFNLGGDLDAPFTKA